MRPLSKHLGKFASLDRVKLAVITPDTASGDDRDFQSNYITFVGGADLFWVLQAIKDCRDSGGHRARINNLMPVIIRSCTFQRVDLYAVEAITVACPALRVAVATVPSNRISLPLPAT